MGRTSPRLSLKARALEWLAQREQSRLELRRKLLRLVRAEQALALQQRQNSGDAAGGDDAAAGRDAGEGEATADQRVEAVLDWLEANRYLSPERFIESRVHARAPRFGNLRIRQELKEHGLAMPAEAAEALKASELDRARAVCARKFDAPADTPADQARQMRFLIGRGFSPEIVRRVVREPRHAGD